MSWRGPLIEIGGVLGHLSPVAWLGSVIEVRDPRWPMLPLAQRREVCDLVDAHAVSPHRTFRLEYDLCDCPLLRMTVFACGPDGRISWDRAAGTVDTEVIERALRTPLPDWWHPSEEVP